MAASAALGAQRAVPARARPRFVPAPRPRRHAPRPENAQRGDLAVFRRMLDGSLDAAEGMERIAQGGGWPLRTNVGFIVAAPDTGASIELAGDHNGWQPAEMSRCNGLRWSHVVAPRGARVGYKLMVDGAYQADPWARRFVYDDHGELSLMRSDAAHIERLRIGGTHGLPTRTLRVWVPSGQVTHHLYVHDGQNLFDPRGPHGGWRLNERVGSHTLVIGIDHSINRFAELTPMADVVRGRELGGDGAAYADFIEHTVRPMIERRYGTPKRVGLMGASLGGLMALYQTVRFAHAYDFAASLSGTVSWGRIGKHDGACIADWVGGPGRATVYLDSGGGPERGDNYDANAHLAATLNGRGYSHGKDLFHWHEPGAAHDERAWSSRVWRPLRIFEGL